MRALKKVLCHIILLCVLVANVIAEEQPISINFLTSEQTILQILALQQKMPMEKNPKEFSPHPQAICFQANINKFLPKNADQLQPIYGCIFSDQVAMNAALLRAGLYVHTEMGIATDDQLYNSKLMTTVGGHDFAGKELVDYYLHATIPTEAKSEHEKLKAIEQEFDHKVLKPILEKNQANFIFFSVINTKKFKENLSHELLHAQYYNYPKIAEILEQVWQEVPKKHQQTIINCLREGGYDVAQHDLVLREFYSYFLQYNAAQYLAGITPLKPMTSLANTYATKIRAALAKNHIKVLTVVNKP
jgi:hypothetical protein